MKALRRGRSWVASTCAFLALSLLATAGLAQGKKPRKPRPAPKAPAAAAPTTPIAPVEPPIVKGKAVEVTIVDVAGGRGYLQPGTTGGVRRNARVTLHGKEYRVVEASDSYAVIDLGEDAVHEKDKGRATVVLEEEDKAAVLSPPRPLATWERAWTEEPAPAAEQQPRFVPLGGPERDRRFDVRFSIAGGGIIPLGGQLGSSLEMAELDARVHAEPFRAPFAIDADGSVQQWAAADLGSRVGGSSRPYLWVRELLASYGSGGWFAGVGRMRYAASTLGTLDGARVEAPLGAGFSLGAFGGLLPNPLGGEVAFDAQRFGVEARYRRPDFGVRPEAGLVVHGSTFGGGLDERRVSGMFALYPGASRLGGHFEVSSFDANNPWKASQVELTAAGLDQSIRIGSFEIGARGDLLQPERSKWLASFLPTSWFCTTVPAAVGAKPTTAEPCDGSNSTRGLGSAEVGYSAGKLSLLVGGNAIGDITQTLTPVHMFGGFATARLVRLARVLRLEASGNYSTGTYDAMYGGTVGPGITLFNDALDLSAYYRLAELQYAANSSPLQQDGFGGAVMLFPSSVIMFTVQGEAITGNDVKALFVFGTMTWRPRL